MPHVRRDAGVPSGHWVDTIGNEGANLLFIDAAQIHETHFAHEIGHLWVQYVDQAEDERVMEDVSDPGRLHQLSFVQSFVTDLRVNQVIAEKGFDVSVIVEDQAASVTSLGRAIEAGYRPENPREGVLMALAIAVQILEERASGENALVKLDETLQKIAYQDPKLVQLANGFAEAVAQHGYQSKCQIRAAIDECLRLAFNFTGDGIDLEKDLVEPSIAEPFFDKRPQWLEGASPQLKCEVGRIMALENTSDGSRWCLSPGPDGKSVLSLELTDGTTKGPWNLEHSHPTAIPVNNVRNKIERNRQSIERKMKDTSSIGIPNPLGQTRRFYMAGLARFFTAVREAEWLGGEHPYSYALNDPVGYKDPSGLHPAIGCSDPCKSACDKFISEYPTACGKIESPNYPPGSVTYAFAFCCDGKPSYCLCPGMNTENPYIKACINVHERGHVAPGGCAPGYTGPPTKTYDECTALKAGIKCAAEQCRKLISNDCIQLEDWRCAECKRLKYACRPMPDASWLSKYCKGCRVQ